MQGENQLSVLKSGGEKMRYLSVFNRVLEEEYKTRAIKFAVKDGKEAEWYIMQICLLHPEKRREELFKLIKGSPYPLNYIEFEAVLKAVNLDSLEKRNYIVKRLKEAVKDFLRFLNGDKSAAKSVEKYMDALVERDKYSHRMYFHAKYLLVYLYATEQIFHSEQMQKVLECYLEGYCTTFLRKVYKGVCKEMQVTSRKSAKEVFDRTNRALELGREEEALDQTMDAVTQITKLKFQIENYQNTLQLVQALFDELKESVEDSAKEARTAAISEFFGTLNANEYGNILDNLGQVEHSLALIKTSHIQVPTEIMPLIIIFKQLLRFFRAYKIEPIELVNRKFYATCNDLTCYNYKGKPFADEKEKKQVVIVTPGWKYEDMIISMPTVQEIS